MALIAEELVEEWLNRRGFFTIRGAKVGNKEMDILAIRPGPDGSELWHYEVTGSLRPMSYIAPLPREVQRASGKRPKNAARRSPELVEQGVAEWVQNKYNDDSLRDLRNSLCNGRWQFAFVYAKAVHGDEELPLIERAGIRLVKLTEVITQLFARNEDGREQALRSSRVGSLGPGNVGTLGRFASNGGRFPFFRSPLGG